MASEASAETKDLLKEAIRFHREGDLTNSERLYTDVLAIDPKQTDALQLLGVIAAQLGNTSVAIERVNQSIAINPNQPGALNNLGNMLTEEERYEEAIDAYERAIYLNPENAQAHFHLGHVFDFVNRKLHAINAHTRATELEPGNASYWNALGSSLEAVARLEDAIEAYQQAIAINSDYISPKDGLGKILRQLGRLDEALEVYQQWLLTAPDNPIAKHYALVCGSPEETPERASADYVKKTFDGFADSFDSLLSDLDYQVPDLLGDIAERLFSDDDRGKLAIVDLGCGTGLCGSHLRVLAKRLVGIDLSPGMLAKARQREQYDELIEGELTEYLLDCSDKYDVMVSADTLIYIGDLRSTFAAAAATLQPGGALLFSLEKLENDEKIRESRHAGYQLGTSGRYAHTESCARNWLDENGFSVKNFVETTVRQEGLTSVTGFLVTAIRNRDN